MLQTSELNEIQARKTASAVREEAVEVVVNLVLDGKIPMEKEAVLTAFSQYVGGEENLQLLDISLDNVFSLVASNVRWMRKKMAN